MGYFAQLDEDFRLAVMDAQYYKSECDRFAKRLELRDGHIVWLREKLKDIAAMKDQKRASDFARETLLEGMGTRPDH
jgi:hypothetical protein